MSNGKTEIANTQKFSFAQTQGKHTLDLDETQEKPEKPRYMFKWFKPEKPIRDTLKIDIYLKDLQK